MVTWWLKLTPFSKTSAKQHWSELLKIAPYAVCAVSKSLVVSQDELQLQLSPVQNAGYVLEPQIL